LFECPLLSAVEKLKGRSESTVTAMSCTIEYVAFH